MTESSTDFLTIEIKHNGERVQLRRVATGQGVNLPGWIQPVLFRALIFIGTLLGKYRAPIGQAARRVAPVLRRWRQRMFSG